MRPSCAALLVTALSAACGVQPLTEYQGSAMSEEIPDSSAIVTLTFWSHTDTSFTGVMKVGAPLTIGGSAYAWHEGATLKVVTVSNAGDTALWTSSLVDDAIGGRYHVNGGNHAGEAGTWRAHLAKGPPLTLATLKAAPSPFPPFGAMVAVALFLGLVAGAARWVRRFPPPDSPIGTSLAEPVGVSGWLALFMIAQILAAVVMAVRLPATLAQVSGPIWQLGHAAALFQPLLVMETLVHVGQIIVPPVGVYLIGTWNRYAPRFWFAYLSCVAVYVLADMAGGELIRSQLATLTGENPLDSSADTRQEVRNNVRALAGAVLWAAYWARSLRVRATFGSCALDKPFGVQSVVAPVAVAAQSDAANAP